ncbi:hypothetical protein V6N13_142502 [Hibiscus sabdariffa]|uniref:Uncharacterized protein n=2 Tax=Hibiscus sabdariffa TaxID=183260 RepID=A0ABR1Z8L6_9ROSI
MKTTSDKTIVVKGIGEPSCYGLVHVIIMHDSTDTQFANDLPDVPFEFIVASSKQQASRVQLDNLTLGYYSIVSKQLHYTEHVV